MEPRVGPALSVCTLRNLVDDDGLWSALVEEQTFSCHLPSMCLHMRSLFRPLLRLDRWTGDSLKWTTQSSRQIMMCNRDMPTSGPEMLPLLQPVVFSFVRDSFGIFLTRTN